MYTLKGIAATSIPMIMSVTGTAGTMGATHGALTSALMTFVTAGMPFTVALIGVTGAIGGAYFSKL